jgi:hypothetical protein
MMKMHDRPLRLLRKLGFAAFLCVAASAADARTTQGVIAALSDDDMMTMQEMGCEFGFGPGNTSFLFGKTDKLMMRRGNAANDRFTCRVEQDEMDRFQEGKATVSCGEFDLTLRKVGKLVGHEEADSQTWPAELTVVDTLKHRRRVIRGEAGVAC